MRNAAIVDKGSIHHSYGVFMSSGGNVDNDDTVNDDDNGMIMKAFIMSFKQVIMLHGHHVTGEK